MDNIAIKLVKDYIIDCLSKDDLVPNFKLYIVWKCRVLQNWKYLIASTLMDGMYYELTYNGNKEEWYFDAYKKVNNKVIKNI